MATTLSSGLIFSIRSRHSLTCKRDIDEIGNFIWKIFLENRTIRFLVITTISTQVSAFVVARMFTVPIILFWTYLKNGQFSCESYEYMSYSQFIQLSGKLWIMKIDKVLVELCLKYYPFILASLLVYCFSPFFAIFCHKILIYCKGRMICQQECIFKILFFFFLQCIFIHWNVIDCAK